VAENLALPATAFEQARLALNTALRFDPESARTHLDPYRRDSHRKAVVAAAGSGHLCGRVAERTPVVASAATSGISAVSERAGAVLHRSQRPG